MHENPFPGAQDETDSHPHLMHVFMHCEICLTCVIEFFDEVSVANVGNVDLQKAFANVTHKWIC